MPKKFKKTFFLLLKIESNRAFIRNMDLLGPLAFLGTTLKITQENLVRSFLITVEGFVFDGEKKKKFLFWK
jgi:hypothetical protein